MPTCADLITEAGAQLHGWGSTQDRITPLAADIGLTDTQFTVQFAFGQSVGITPGVVEINSEQLYVTNVDAATGICTLAQGLGRGYNGTTAAAHTAGSVVISRPKFPRATLFKQLNEVIGGLYPQLFRVNQSQSVVTFPSNTYTMDSDPARLIDVQWQDPVGNWQRVWAYSIDPYDDTVRVGGDVMIGRPIRFLYATEPTPFTSEADNFSLTGLPSTAADLLTMGTVARVVPGLDISRAQLSSVEQSDRSRVVPPFAGVNASKYLMALFKDRLQNEAMSLRSRYKTRLVRTW